MLNKTVISILNKTKYIFQFSRFSSKVPSIPVPTLEKTETEIIKVDTNTISLLERLSLVKCDTDEGVKVLEDSIVFADKILHINTDNVEPLYTVLENQNLTLREDKITQGNCQADILRNAVLKEEEYFVAPPGNIPLHEKFFKKAQITKNKIIVELETPSKILVQNIHHSWLKSINGKTVQHFPVYLNKNIAQKFGKIYYGFIDQHSFDMNKVVYDDNGDQYNLENNVLLKFNLIVPQPDVMQYFIQWQRYRKFWWSSVTTTPSLFSINDMKHGMGRSEVNIIANFKWGSQIVETISINSNGSDNLDKNMAKNTSCLTCTMSLETAFVTLLLDGLSNATKEEYLRLHNKMAPYKISFALDSEGMLEEPKVLSTLKDLAKLLFHKLKSKDISAWLPGFTLSIQSQVKENLHLGVTYTAILNENTLSNGIFHLLNSNTMLKEQVHVADFDTYAALLCKK